MFGLELENWQIIAIIATFAWGGFVRGAFSFGGAALSLPILLLIYPEPLFFLPIIAVHLLVFGAFSVYKRRTSIDWRYWRKLLLLLLPAKILGLIGLLQLPANVLVYIIYGFCLFYALNFLLLRDFVPRSRLVDALMLMLGGYMSGIALSGAPIIVAIAARDLPRHNLRGTLFALWCALVIIKLSAIALAGYSLQWEQQLWLLPPAAIGTYAGARVHRYLEGLSEAMYYRTLGVVLAILGLSGIIYYLAT